MVVYGNNALFLQRSFVRSSVNLSFQTGIPMRLDTSLNRADFFSRLFFLPLNYFHPSHILRDRCLPFDNLALFTIHIICLIPRLI